MQEDELSEANSESASPWCGDQGYGNIPHGGEKSAPVAEDDHRF
jgi:hypothetical protein